MRFMLLMIPSGDATARARTRPPLELAQKMTKYDESLSKAGVLLGRGGLEPPSTGARVRFSGGKPCVTDVPITEVREVREVREVVAGYWLIEVRSKAEAVEWARRCPALEGDVIELRRVLGMSDFPPESG